MFIESKIAISAAIAAASAAPAMDGRLPQPPSISSSG